ncbi:hypothetical protein [Flavobacterium tyrosinilyticum]|uniref:hypothetical protein n=1 Tax=Flavobacterium tyrosinilyticum TaxID=1658740 RepID=UPI00202E5B78|nr:hypothetical protein [Flavobacterium tyrosinilyticum]MCM0665104.1 hypothetical protein [Flavobacterium tyrosinilyticum]
MKVIQVIINRIPYWLTFEAINVETEKGIEEVPNKIICYYSSTQPNQINYGTTLKDENNISLTFETIQIARETTIDYLERIVYPPTFIHPLEYKKEDLPEIMHKPLTFDIGSVNSDIIKESLSGIMTQCSLAANYPHLPGTATIQTTTGQIRSFNFFEIKRVRN